MRQRLEPVEPPMGQIVEQTAETRHREHVLRRLETMEKLLDRQFGVAGFRFGWDSIIGLIPVAGDTLGAGISGWLIWKAHRLGAPAHLKARMIANAGVDYALGLVPLLGDIGDAVFKANTKNVRLLKAFLQEQRKHDGMAGEPPRQSIDL